MFLKFEEECISNLFIHLLIYGMISAFIAVAAKNSFFIFNQVFISLSIQTVKDEKRDLL